MPAQDRVWLDQQPEPAEDGSGEAVQQGGQEGPVGGGEPRPVTSQLPFQDGDWVAQGQDLGVFIPVAYRKEPQ